MKLSVPLYTSPPVRSAGGAWLRRLHLDPPLLGGLVVLAILGLVVLYSAGGQSWDRVSAQMVRMGLGFTVMVMLAQISPARLARGSVWLYGIGVLLLVAVLMVGDISKGAQRWLDLGVIRFQPSEILRLAVPMMVAWYLAERPLPPTKGRLLGGLLLVLVPAVLIAKQPDLGTALLVACAGLFVLLLSGVYWRYVAGVLGSVALLAWPAWHLMHDYQRQRVLTLLDPEQDPLGTGYHIIQSKIAIGSGGFYGKGWLNGTQSYLDFIPERSTDFIFAVLAEEFGLLGFLIVLSVYVFIILRGLYIATQAQTTYARLLAGSLTLAFSVYVFVNIGMVAGLLPVVGVPLPLISYGGTSLVTVMAGFGVIMALHSHRKLVGA